MIIANPIYDVVFKYLLEDLSIARDLLTTIIGEEVIALEVQPQETVLETAAALNIFRVDFKATIRLPSGDTWKVLIELQKAKRSFDIARFRRYLGENYRRDDEVMTEEGILESRTLPIVTIYFLGFKLPNTTVPVLRISRVYQNAATGAVVNVREEFVEQLTHDSYVVQIPHLKGQTQSRLERVLQIFNQKQKTNDAQRLDFDGTIDDPLLERMADRLNRAIADDDFRNRMDAEEEVERTIGRLMREKDKAIAKILATKEQELEVSRQEVETRKQEAEQERLKAEAVRQQAEQEKQTLEQRITELERRLNNPNNLQ
jgi:hypothetical protein